jgi:4-hydroxy-2-oxoheptanedioate aldolase
MTRDPLSARLSRGEPLVGTILKMSSPATVELVGHLDFDLAIIDTEHGLNGGSELDHHLRAADVTGLPVLVRVSHLDRSEIQRALDGGAAGVIVPQVESGAGAAEAVRLAHYPPFGARGLATSTRAGRQGTFATRDYLEHARDTTVVVAQIESRAGVANAAEIIGTPGISAVWIGLSDLSLDLGHFGDFAHPEVAAAIDAVVDGTRSAGLPLMVIADTEADGAIWVEHGAQVLLINLLAVVARGLSGLKRAHALARTERNNA